MKRPALLLCASLLVMACASSSAPTSTGTAPTGTPASDENAKAAQEDIADGKLTHHPFKNDIVNLVAPAVCKAYPQGWSGDGIIEIKDGKVVSFQAGDGSGMEALHDLDGKPAPAIPPELAPLFAKPVALSVFC